jgi:hypothetical protein
MTPNYRRNICFTHLFYFLLFIIHYSLFIIRYSLFTFYFLLFTFYYLLFTIYFLLFTFYFLLFNYFIFLFFYFFIFLFFYFFIFLFFYLYSISKKVVSKVCFYELFRYANVQNQINKNKCVRSRRLEAAYVCCSVKPGETITVKT